MQGMQIYILTNKLEVLKTQGKEYQNAILRSF